MKQVFSLAAMLAVALPASAQNVGVGTINPTHGRLEIVAPSGNQFVARTSSTGPGISASVNTGGQPGIGFNSMFTTAGNYMGTGYGSSFRFDTSTGRLYYITSNSKSTSANSVMFSSTVFSIEQDGQLALGSHTPLEGLHLRGRNIRLDNNSGQRAVQICFAGSGAAAAGGEIRLFAHNDPDSTIVIRGSDASGQGGEMLFYDPGTNELTMELDGDYANSGRSRIIVDELQIKGGADFAEYFDVAAADEISPEAGMLVSIDESTPGKLVVSSKASDKKVAGVISGAGGVRPGLMMGQGGSVANGAHPVAITGRVFVKADASRRAIAPGDLLTTSDVPGHAMRAGRGSRGAVIGKAMSGLAKGEKGEVLVLLGIQ